MTGLLHALICVSLARNLSADQVKGRGFESRTPYDLRQILPERPKAFPNLVPKEAICNYVSVLDHEFSPELVASMRSSVDTQEARMGEDQYESKIDLPFEITTTVWTTAQRIRLDIEKRLEAGTKNDLIAIMKFVSDWREQQASETRRDRKLGWLLTNLGVLDGSTPGCSPTNTTSHESDGPDAQQGWSIRAAHFVVSAEVCCAAFLVAVMTVKGGDMCVSCSWQDGVVKDGLGERLVADLERWIVAMGDDVQAGAV